MEDITLGDYFSLPAQLIDGLSVRKYEHAPVDGFTFINNASKLTPILYRMIYKENDYFGDQVAIYVGSPATLRPGPWVETVVPTNTVTVWFQDSARPGMVRAEPTEIGLNVDMEALTKSTWKYNKDEEWERTETLPMAPPRPFIPIGVSCAPC